MIAAALFVLSATAAEPPQFPARHARHANECQETIGITAEQRTPLVDLSGVAVCSGVLIPLSEAAYLVDVREYALALKAHADAERARAAADYAKLSAVVERERRWSRAATAWAIVSTGAAFGVALYATQ